jgi:hypothetical protein
MVEAMNQMLKSDAFRVIEIDEFSSPRVYVFDGSVKWLGYRLKRLKTQDLENFFLFCRRSFLEDQYVKDVFFNYYSLTTLSQDYPLFINRRKVLPRHRTYSQLHPTPISISGFVGKYLQTCTAKRSRYQLSLIMNMLFQSFNPENNQRKIFVTTTGGTADRDSLPEFLSHQLRLENSILIICTPDRGDYVQ